MKKNAKTNTQKDAARQAKGRSFNRADRRPPQARRTHSSTLNRDFAEPFSPPENWYEPREDNKRDGSFKSIVQSPGWGYRHVVTPEEVRERLTQVPQHFLKELDVVQISGMTRKKQSFPCYGLQWGTTIYLYPLEESLEEHFYSPPAPQVINEAKMFGGLWDRPEAGVWRLTWTEDTIRDFYLNNILIHELGHLVDDRNSSYLKREQFAEWFAIEYGYRATGGGAARRSQPIRRRHHKV
ncbi:hypothetical protein [Adhaeretor mobilis]|uniref:Uncharacterized protein n=1 Tax=Adhaeretor mobilis TaxID=1930276 RepID=A0A517MXU7_9BACT|nr:hypothetical protein [Adhaeretor mobilis]QDS99699.1 hypothetical protein HG15A2_30260 [Adhaeretor mobilis]